MKPLFERITPKNDCKELEGRIEDWYQRLVLEYPEWMRTDDYEKILKEMDELINKASSFRKP